MKSRQSKKSAALHKAAQLALFPLTARLRRIRPELNEWRFYAMSVQPDLFGGAALVRQWGRIGTTGSQCLDLYPDEGTAINALSKNGPLSAETRLYARRWSGLTQGQCGSCMALRQTPFIERAGTTRQHCFTTCPPCRGGKTFGIPMSSHGAITGRDGKSSARICTKKFLTVRAHRTFGSRSKAVSIRF
ncbi:WGR domain-containing protein (plasmid) [Novacetimonas hansenii]|nr:WGR domain-containing protein [Novacetimonas hansenii]WEQ60575.1 WGR domain-containing protein [Novacetimonas hansenii]